MKPRSRTGGLIVEHLPTETVVYDQARETSHVLNRTASLVFRYADGTRTVSDITSLLRDELDPVADEDLVYAALGRLKAAQLLDGSIGQSPDAARLSRRRFVRKIGVVGSLSLLLPAIESVFLGTPEALAASPLFSTGGPVNRPPVTCVPPPNPT